MGDYFWQEWARHAEGDVDSKSPDMSDVDGNYALRECHSTFDLHYSAWQLIAELALYDHLLEHMSSRLVPVAVDELDTDAVDVFDEAIRAKLSYEAVDSQLKISCHRSKKLVDKHNSLLWSSEVVGEAIVRRANPRRGYRAIVEKHVRKSIDSFIASERERGLVDDAHWGRPSFMVQQGPTLTKTHCDLSRVLAIHFSGQNMALKVWFIFTNDRGMAVE
ncbi:unnamed protein product (mitochondrion) [Plasmodiophora brassicae]|uniref:Uncharacterized protein n=1 Tax=Plasmodiophora brassicae TaxID=37360 RepID=A0A3P3YNU3_PLABS|nr:unnamed protein product [Plasmodiophora brassicae]